MSAAQRSGYAFSDIQVNICKVFTPYSNKYFHFESIPGLSNKLLVNVQRVELKVRIRKGRRILIHIVCSIRQTIMMNLLYSPKIRSTLWHSPVQVPGHPDALKTALLPAQSPPFVHQVSGFVHG